MNMIDPTKRVEPMGILLSSLWLLCSLFFYSRPLHAETISIGRIDYCPYQCIAEKEEGKIGFVAEVVQRIFEKAGYSVTFEPASFKRTILGTETGRYDAVLLTNTAHSTLLLLSREKTGVLKQYFYVKKGSLWQYDGIKSLATVRVGSIIGYDYSPFNPEYQAYLQKNQNTPKVQYIGGEDATLRNFRQILSGRITTFNEDEAVFSYVTMQSGITDKFEVAGSLGENVQYMGFSPKNPNTPMYRDIFDKGIREARENGSLKAILDKYGVGDWQE